MRKKLNEFERIRSIVEFLTKNEETSDVIQTIIHVELMAVGCHLIDKNINLYDAWSLLTGYDEPIIPKNVDKKIIARLRILFSRFVGQSYWEKEIEKYREVPRKYRLIDISNQGSFTFLKPTFDPDRKEVYEEILKNPISKTENKLEFASAGPFTYSRVIENKEHHFYGEIPSNWIKKNKRLRRYNPKSHAYFDLNFDWLKIAKEMDLQIQSETNEWQKRSKNIRLISKDKSRQQFVYKGVQHIVGGLAAGKSTFRMINTYWLVRKKGLKVGMIENSVAQVNERVQELRKLGIRAVPIIGIKERKKHLNNYLSSQRVHSVEDLLSHDTIASLSDICIIQSISEDIRKDEKIFYPCKSLYQGIYKRKNRKLCPLSYMCGVYKDWSELVDAEVWVTTPSATLHSRIPPMIDPYERLIYEAMYDLLDVIFVDEADIVQKLFEEAFLKEHEAFGNPENLVEKLVKQLDEIRGNYGLADNHLLVQWRKNLYHLQESIWSLYAAIKKSKKTRSFLKNQVIYLNYLIHDISKTITKNDDEQEKVAELMRQFVKKANYLSIGNSEERLHNLINVLSDKEKRKLIDDWLQNISKLVSINEKVEVLYSKIEFFVYLAHIENSLKYILHFYTIVQKYLNSDVEVPLLHQIHDFIPFIKEAMTAVMFGYRYETEESKETGQFKIIQYLAVGRELLTRWSTIYENADEKIGPAVVLLSGTSYAPKSLHYHLELEPNWYIQSSQTVSNLTQHFLEIRDSENNEEVINVSGVFDPTKRNTNLKKIVGYLSNKIELELEYWKSKGEERKVLLLTNSYDDVSVVGEALIEQPLWNGRYRLLSQNNKNDEIWFPRTNIERFVDTEADILVAPILSISRGYNILNKDRTGALFGSAFFLIRPYPVPNDLSYYVQILHGTLPIYLEEIQKEGLHYVEAMRKLRKRSRGHFEYLYEKADFWSLLSKKEKIVLSWYTFIPIWQTIGRLMRGGKDARIFYCDAKFMDKGNGNLSMIEYWSKMMSENEQDSIFLSLYEPFVNSIKQLRKVEIF